MTLRALQTVLPPLQRRAPVINNSTFVQVLEHEKMMAKGARFCIIWGHRVGIVLCRCFVWAQTFYASRLCNSIFFLNNSCSQKVYERPLPLSIHGSKLDIWREPCDRSNVKIRSVNGQSPVKVSFSNKGSIGTSFDLKKVTFLLACQESSSPPQCE
jgi:hypothetical protein